MKTKMLTKQSENPFYGKTELLGLYQDISKTTLTKDSVFSSLARTYRSCKTKDEKALFFSLIFMAGDITDREHNILPKNAEAGGEGNRSFFRWAMEWLKRTDISLYERFLLSDAIRQYTNLENVIGGNVWTEVGKSKIKEVWSALEGVDLTLVAEYLAKIINSSTEAQKTLIAKWLTLPVLRARKKINRKTKEPAGKRKLQPATFRRMELLRDLYLKLSDIMRWEVKKTPSYVNFVGLREWRRKYNRDLESVLFSTGNIEALKKSDFLALLENMPSGARYRVRRRILDGNDEPKAKWPIQFAQWFIEWEKTKEKAQEKVRVLAEQTRNLTRSIDPELEAELSAAKKAAKVTTGGSNLAKMIEQFLSGTISDREADLILEQIVQKTIFKVPVLVIADDSGSMSSNYVQTQDRRQFSAVEFSRFLATMAILKNPSADLQDMLIRFGSDAHVFVDSAEGIDRQNRFMAGSAVKTKLVDRTKSFLENYQNMRRILNAGDGSTNFGAVADAFKLWLDRAESEAVKQVRREMIQQYPVFLVISDGDMNNASSAAHSMAQFQQKMRQWFGWEGVVVIMDVKTSANQITSKFEGLPNVIHYTSWNLGAVNSVFTKIDDLEIIDVYTPLNAIFKMTRYEMIRNIVNNYIN